MQGYIKLHRSLLDWEWYNDSVVKDVFLHLLLSANHKDNKYKGIEIKKGQLLTGRLKLASDLNFTEMQIRTALKKLKSTNEITIKTTSKYSIISIKNWDKYQQDNQQDNQQTTNKQPTNNQQITTNNNEKNDKNDKNEKNIFVIPKIEEIKKYCNERNNKINPLQFYDYYQSKGWMIGKNKMKDWQAAVRTWEQKNKANSPPTPYREYNPSC